MELTYAAAALGTVIIVRALAHVWRKRSVQAKPSRPLSEYAHVLDIPQPLEFEHLPTPYGLGVFSTRDVKKGELVYRGRSVLIPNIPGRVLIRNGSSFIELDVIVHSVLRHHGNMRDLYAYDAYMNHSCDPNVTTNYTEGEHETHYETFALRDIKKGEQLTCDYETFEWDCRDKKIDACGCGSSKCRKRVWGYKFIQDAALRLELYDSLKDCVKDSFLQEEPEVATQIASAKALLRDPPKQ